MRNRILMALGGAGLVLFGVVVGMLVGGRMPAFAAPTTQHSASTSSGSGMQRYCGIYQQALATNLNVDAKALAQANQHALATTLDQAVNDGQLTAIEAAQIELLMRQAGTPPCLHLSTSAIRTLLQNDAWLMQQGFAARSALWSAVASALHLSPATLVSDRQRGEAIAQIAQAQEVPLAKVNTAYLATAQSLLAQAVSSGAITREQSQHAYSALTTAVEKGDFLLL